MSQPSAVRAWLLATRPATLLAGVIPVVVAAAMAWEHPLFRWDMALLAGFGAVLIQIATNFANDYYDFIKGADNDDRVGPKRATHQGWITPEGMKRATLVVLAVALLIGLVLIERGGWPIAALGLSSLLLAVGYTAGPFPLAYLGLGDVFVLLYFGLGATVGSVWVMSLEAPMAAWIAGVGLGVLGTAVLVVNNLRDRHTDAEVGKNTLAVRFGERFVRREYALLLIIAYGVVALGVALDTLPKGCLLVLLSLPLAVKTARSVFSLEGTALNPLLGATARLEAVYGLLFAIGWNL